MGSGVMGGVPLGRRSTAGEAGSGSDIGGCRAGEVGLDDNAPCVALRARPGLASEVVVGDEDALSTSMSLARLTEGDGADIIW